METKETGLALLDADKMVSISATLKDIVTSHKLYTDIQGKKFVWVEGWCVAGNRLGLTALPKTPVKLQGKENETAYGCECDIVRLDSGFVIGHGYSICSNIEANKVKWQEYAIASMAQTRAVSRAYRNTIGFVMKLMGNEFMATPAEEMDFSKQDDIDADAPPALAKEMATGLVGKKITQDEADKIKASIKDFAKEPDYPEICIDLGIGKIEDLPALRLKEARVWLINKHREAKEVKNEVR